MAPKDPLGTGTPPDLKRASGGQETPPHGHRASGRCVSPELRSASGAPLLSFERPAPAFFCWHT
eukprot:13274018-Alexandrium_andersonii.AAC.1